MKTAPPHWLLARLPYRVRQFALAALAPVAPAEVEAALRRAALPPPAARLFRAMPRPYRRHALNVAARLAAEGTQDAHLLQAALLHDMGKWDPATGARVNVVYRALATLLALVGPGQRVLARLAAGPPPARSWRYPWYLQEAHAALSARLAERAGVHADVVALIRHHQDAAGIPAHLRPALARLQRADDQE